MYFLILYLRIVAEKYMRMKATMKEFPLGYPIGIFHGLAYNFILNDSEKWTYAPVTVTLTTHVFPGGEVCLVQVAPQPETA